MANQNASLPRDDDPFFKLPSNHEWNACIGRQGSEEAYIDGYIDAAIELADTIIERRMYGKRDTLCMPILYNARHALELSLKFTINKLVEMGIVEEEGQKNHDISRHWRILNQSRLGDKALREYVMALKPYVTSLSQIDADGQELRYPESRNGKKSLDSYFLANIEVIRASLHELGKEIRRLMERIFHLREERPTGSYTTECSRYDLIEIAQMLPNKSSWKKLVFVEAKNSVMDRFELTNSQFSRAVDLIKSNREMRSLIGLETSLVHLSDEKILFTVEHWARLHPAREADKVPRIRYHHKTDYDSILKERRILSEVIEVIHGALTNDEIADLETIFEIGRGRLFCERYEKMLQLTQENHSLVGQAGETLKYLMQKGWFSHYVLRGAAILGRRQLSSPLLEARPHVLDSPASTC